MGLRISFVPGTIFLTRPQQGEFIIRTPAPKLFTLPLGWIKKRNQNPPWIELVDTIRFQVGTHGGKPTVFTKRKIYVLSDGVEKITDELLGKQLWPKEPEKPDDGRGFEWL